MTFSSSPSSSFESENLTAEKIDAMKRFERRRKLWRLLPVVEALVAVLVLLSCLPPPISNVNFSGEYLRRFSGDLSRGVFVFAVVNVLVAVIFYLSNLQKQIEPDLYSQYVSSSAAATALVDGSPATDEADTFRDKQGTDVNINVHAVTPEKTEITRPVNFGKEQTNGAVKSDGGSLTARREMVRAVSSVVGRREMTVKPLAREAQIYRRSTSERLDRRRMSRRWCEIDDLSSEDFRTTVETFIAGKKMMLSRETFDV